MSIADQRFRSLDAVRPVVLLEDPAPETDGDPLAALLGDPTVSEIMVNGPRRIFVRRGGRTEAAAVRFVDAAHLRRVIDDLLARAGRRVDEANPVVDARLPDGTRLNAVVPPIAVDGAMLTIRKKCAATYGIDELIANGTMRRAIAYFLAACVRGRLDVVLSGGSGVGKTTTLNVLAQFFPTDERIVTIEEVAELRLPQQHVLRLESRPEAVAGPAEVTVRDLVRIAHRMRPDRIVVGELRDGAALDLLQAMSTGPLRHADHDQRGLTGGGDAPAGDDGVARRPAVSRPGDPCGAGVGGRPGRAPGADADGTHRVTQVTEVVGMAGDDVRLQDLFVFDYGAGEDEHGRLRGGLVYTGLRPHFLDRLTAAGIAVPYGASVSRWERHDRRSAWSACYGVGAAGGPGH